MADITGELDPMWSDTSSMSYLSMIKSKLINVFKKNIKGALLVIALEALMMFAYEHVSPFIDFMDLVGSLKTDYPILFSFLSTGVFMGVIPSLISFYRNNQYTNKPLLLAYMFISYGLVVCSAFHDKG